MMTIRQIVKDAFKVDQLVYQFTRIDCEDGLLTEGTMAEVNEKYTDAHIIKEAEHHQDMSFNNIDDCYCNEEELKIYKREYNQATRFLAKHRKAGHKPPTTTEKMTPPPIVEADCEMNCGYAEVRSGECECYNKEADAQDDR
jgi:hypothetical protein